MHTAAINADISMQDSSLTVSEDMSSVDVCAVINGVAGNVEEAVTATLTLMGSGNDCTHLLWKHNTIKTLCNVPLCGI